MLTMGGTRYWTRALLTEHLRALDLSSGDHVMAHGAMRAVGPMMNGPDALIGALIDCVGAQGTVAAYLDWDAVFEAHIGPDGRVDPTLRPHIPPFDPLRSRTARDMGVFSEFFRTTQGVLRSVNPGASVGAIGAKAAWLTADHPLTYGYGEGSPFAKLVEARGKVIMIGAPLETMTLLHHAEHLARIPDKRFRRHEVPVLRDGQTVWEWIEEFDTSHSVIAALEDDYFTQVVEDYLASGQGKRGLVGNAPSVVVDAATMTAFAVDWLERRFPLNGSIAKATG